LSGLNEYATVTTAASYLSASDKRVYFGLGKDEEAKSIDIAWPSGKIQHLGETKADRILDVTEPR
jgi:hypothetical protein